MNHILFILLIVGVPALLSWPLGRYMKWAMDAEKDNAFNRLFKKIAGGAAARQVTWKGYAAQLLLFNALMFTICFGILTFQHVLPLNPDKKGPLDASLVFNTTASFTSNTNLQHYSGEVSMSYLSQLVALMWLQFVSAATGVAALAAIARGLANRQNIGNFFIDLQRAAILVLLPFALIWAILIGAGGVPMTLDGAAIARTMEGAQQTIARGPVAAFVAIKQLGTNGGGFFGPNSAHPLENPTFLTNALEMFAILIIPMACVWMFGRIIGNLRHAGVIFGVMLVFLVGKMSLAVFTESQPTLALDGTPVEEVAYNFEGKELRLGTSTSPVWSVATTATSNGSVGSMHNSLNPLTGLLPLTGMWLNTTFGGVGVGLINMIIYIVIAVFVAGMMVGRTPEYLGKRVETREMVLAVVALLIHPLFILGGSAFFAATAFGADSINNPGARGLTEIVYEFSSAAANNGSGYEGLSDGTTAWNIVTGIIMLLGRYLPILLPLAIVGSLATKKVSAQSRGTLGTSGLTFGIMLAGTILFLGALTFFPVAILGPVLEHLSGMLTA